MKIAVQMKGAIMKIVVIGGTGLIGSKLVTKLREHGHEAVPASPNSGVNTLTGEGLAEVLKGASVEQAIDYSYLARAPLTLVVKNCRIARLTLIMAFRP